MRIAQWCLVAACLIQLGVFVRKQTRLREVVDAHSDEQHHVDPFPDLAADEVRRSEPSPAVQRVGQGNGPDNWRKKKRSNALTRKKMLNDRSGTRPRTADPFPDLLDDVGTTKIRFNQFGTRLHTLGSLCRPPRRKDKTPARAPALAMLPELATATAPTAPP